MATTKSKFTNVIVCEDIRDEVGNKKSLMGVMAGDIFVNSLPATISIAVFLEYQPDADDSKKLLVDIRIMQGDEEIAKAKIESNIEDGQHALMILPRALIGFEKETNFRMLVSANGRAEEEILTRKIRKTPTS